MIWIPNKSLKFKPLNVDRSTPSRVHQKHETPNRSLKFRTLNDVWVGLCFLEMRHVGVFPGHVKVQEKSVNIGLRKLEEVPYRTCSKGTQATSDTIWHYHLIITYHSPDYIVTWQKFVGRLQRVWWTCRCHMEDVSHFARMETLVLCNLQWFMFCCLLLLGDGVIWIR